MYSNLDVRKDNEGHKQQVYRQEKQDDKEHIRENKNGLRDKKQLDKCIDNQEK